MKFYCIDIEAATEAVDIVPRDQETKTFPPHSPESDEGNQEDMLIPYVITPKKKPPCEDKKDEQNDDNSRESSSSEDEVSYSPVEKEKKQRKRKRKRKHKHKKKRVKVERSYENERYVNCSNFSWRKKPNFLWLSSPRSTWWK